MTHLIAPGSRSAPAARGFRHSLPRLVLVAALIASALVGAGGCKSVSDKSIKTIGFSEVQRPFQKGESSVLFIDPRPLEEYTAGHIPGAIHLRLPDVDENDPDPALSKYKVLVVYGNNPGSPVAKAMVKLLLRSGFKEARWFQGGMDAWREAGMPVAEGASSR